MVGKGQRNAGFLFLLILTCGLIGGFIGEMLKPYLPSILSESFNIGIGPSSIDLKLISLTIGFSMSMNFFSILGLVTALIIYRKF